MIVFTSCLVNYLPKARVLGASLKKFHPDWNFILLLGEPIPDGELRKSDPFDSIVYYEDLKIPNLRQWMFKHSVVEICTAVKGAAACYFLEELKSDKVIYMDPDIQVFNSLHEISNLLDTYDILLIPHHLKPQSNYDMIVANELSQMRNGTFNLGFIAFARRSEGLFCARWWRNRLYQFCRNDVANGLFTDQRWCDLIPSYFNNYHIIKDPGYDVASWNLTDRYVWIDENGIYRVNNKPIRFYHFTGYDSGVGKWVVSHYFQQMPDVAKLWDNYEALLIKYGSKKLTSNKWRHDYFDDGTYITNHMRMVYRDKSHLQDLYANPFSTENENCYLNWYKKNASHLIVNYSYDNPANIYNSYSWQFIGSKFYAVESFIKKKLQIDKYPSRPINYLLISLRENYNKYLFKINPKVFGRQFISLSMAFVYVVSQTIVKNIKKIFKNSNNVDTVVKSLSVVEPNQLYDNINIYNDKKNVLYDLFFCRGFHGGGEYGKALFASLCNKADMNGTRIWAALKFDEHIEEYLMELFISKKVMLIPVNGYNDIIDLVNADFFDSFFAPAIVVYTGYEYQKKIGNTCRFKCKKTKVIGVIHDVRDVEFALDAKKYLYYRKHLKLRPEAVMNIRQIKKIEAQEKINAEKLIVMYKNIFECDSIYKLITDSRYSRNSIDKLIGNYSDKLLTCYPPMKHRATDVVFKINGTDPAIYRYALMVNAHRWEKNTAAAIIAFDLFFSENPFEDFYLIIIGVGGINDLGIKKINNIDKFIFVKDMINSNNLEYLYKNSLFFVYPSFSEGFGYPPIEVMSYLKPSIVSNKGSIPEIYGKAAVYCDPFKLDSIKNAINQIITKPPSEYILKKQYTYITEKQQEDLGKLINVIIQ